MKTIGFIGGGNMAGALIEGILAKGLVKPDAVWVSDVQADRLAELKKQYGLHVTQVNTELTAAADTIVLSVKPQILGNLLDEIAGSIRQDALILSIAAGKTCKFILDRLGPVQLVRAMPNTPALIGVGAAGLYNATASEAAFKTAISIFNAVGTSVIVDKEDLIDSVTAVSGSGPAYFFLLMEQMISAGVKLGLDEATATELVLQTAKGAALLAEAGQKAGETPAILRKKVTSPGGTTEAAINIFEKNSFSDTVHQALKAAFDRGQELSKTQ